MPGKSSAERRALEAQNARIMRVFEDAGFDHIAPDILQPAETPQNGPGLYYMDTSSAAAECVTLMAAGGYVVHTFPTGQGNVIGNPIVPVIKISGNPKTIRTMPEHIDVDVSGILRRDLTIPQAGDALIENIVRTANGRLTAAEALGHREFSMTKLYRSA